MLNITVQTVMSLLISYKYTLGHLYYKMYTGGMAAAGSEHHILVLYMVSLNIAYYKYVGVFTILHTITEIGVCTMFIKFLPYPLLYLSILRWAGPL